MMNAINKNCQLTNENAPYPLDLQRLCFMVSRPTGAILSLPSYIDITILLVSQPTLLHQTPSTN